MTGLSYQNDLLEDVFPYLLAQICHILEYPGIHDLSYDSVGILQRLLWAKPPNIAPSELRKQLAMPKKAAGKRFLHHNGLIMFHFGALGKRQHIPNADR